MRPVNMERKTEVVRAREVAGLTLVETAYPAGMSMPRHAHEHAGFGLVLQGGYTEKIGGRDSARQKSNFLMRPPAEEHAVLFHSRVRIFRVDVKDRRLERLGQRFRAFDGLADPQRVRLVRLAARLYGEFQRMDEVAPLAIEGLALEIIAEASRRGIDDKESRAPRWLERAKEMLHAQFNENLALADLAEAAGKHPVYLARQFRRYYDCSIGEFVRQLRVERACAEIAASDAPLAEVAASVGFYDQSHFTNTFKRLTGMTPTEFRAITRPR